MGNAKKSGEAPELEKGTELFSFKFQINDVVRQSVSRDVYQSVARYFHPKSKNKYRTKREYLAERYLLCCFRTVDSNSQVILRVTFFQTEAKQKKAGEPNHHTQSPNRDLKIKRVVSIKAQFQVFLALVDVPRIF